MKNNTMHHILRIFIPENAMERRTTEVIDYCLGTVAIQVADQSTNPKQER